MKKLAFQCVLAGLTSALVLSSCGAPSAGVAGLQAQATGSGCAALTWQPDTNYALGDIVLYPANNKYYRVVNVVAGGTDKTVPTISTWYWKEIQTWQPQTNYALGDTVRYSESGKFYQVVNVLPDGTTDRTDPTISTYFWKDLGTCQTPPPTGPTPPATRNPLPARIVAGYYPNWLPSAPRLRDIDPNYNLIYLFHAVPDPGQPAGTLRFDPPASSAAWNNWKADLQYARQQQGKRFLLSVGGAGAGFQLTDRAASENFVKSVERLYSEWGGFDGLDFNNFEADVAPKTSEMIWAAKRLKALHPGFIISAPPAPWNQVDQQFCKDMLSAGALDYCAPQYYDDVNLVKPAYVAESIKTWMSLLGPEHVVVGFGVAVNANPYWTVDSAASTFSQIKTQYPAVKGAFAWQMVWDAENGYPFAQRFGALLR